MLGRETRQEPRQPGVEACSGGIEPGGCGGLAQAGGEEVLPLVDVVHAEDEVGFEFAAGDGGGEGLLEELAIDDRGPGEGACVVGVAGADDQVCVTDGLDVDGFEAGEGVRGVGTAGEGDELVVDGFCFRGVVCVGLWPEWRAGKRFVEELGLTAPSVGEDLSHHRAGAGGLAPDRDVAGVAAEVVDVFLHPLEDILLVQEAGVEIRRWRALDCLAWKEAEGIDPVVGVDDHIVIKLGYVQDWI